MNLLTHKTDTSDGFVRLKDHQFSADQTPPASKQPMSSTEMPVAQEPQLLLFRLAHHLLGVIRQKLKQTAAIQQVQIMISAGWPQEAPDVRFRLDPAKYAPVQLRKKRELEMLWLADHKKELKKYQGEWIGLEGYNLLAHHKQLNEVVRQLKEAGVKVPFTTFVPEQRTGIFMGV